MNKQIIIIGGFHEIIEMSEELGLEIVGLVDNDKTGSYYSYPILGNDMDIHELYKKYSQIPLVITPDKPSSRQTLVSLYIQEGFSFKSLVSSSAKISKTARIGAGSIIQSDANISSEALVGDFVKLNTKCNIMHNAFIDDYTTIAPNAVILGNVKIGKLCYIGANATVLPNLTICDNSIIGAGAVVTKNITHPGTYIGIPSRFLK